jgi:dGTPase
MTHSLEVAQIAKSIALKIKNTHSDIPIEPDVCEIAGLIHDVGHPPFGHNGEKALHDKMKSNGGFEGNAQSLRIITRIEKTEKPEELFDQTGDRDYRTGLNLTARVIASALKYDECIPEFVGDNVVKGYYFSEKPIVDKVKECVLGAVPSKSNKKFKTIECSVMDLADDIAYSTHDIEDAFKAGFLSPLSVIAAEDSILQQIVDKLKKDGISCSVVQCRTKLVELFAPIWSDTVNNQKEIRKNDKDFERKTLQNILQTYSTSQEHAQDGYMRTAFTSYLVNDFINGISTQRDNDFPVLSSVGFNEDTLLRVNILKHFAYVCLINSSRLKVAENRGEEIVGQLFDRLNGSNGVHLLPEDYQSIYNKARNKKRIICDFIAGMTDRYALEFYGRLFSESPQTIFKPI